MSSFYYSLFFREEGEIDEVDETSRSHAIDCIASRCDMFTDPSLVRRGW